MSRRVCPLSMHRLRYGANTIMRLLLAGLGLTAFFDHRIDVSGPRGRGEPQRAADYFCATAV